MAFLEHAATDWWDLTRRAWKRPGDGMTFCRTLETSDEGDEMRRVIAGLMFAGALGWGLAAGAQAGSAKPEGKALSAYSIVVVDKFTVDPAAYQNGYIKGEE